MKSTHTSLLALALTQGCSSDYASADKAERDYDTAAARDESQLDSDSARDPGAEVEEDFLTLRPAQTDIHVFIVNPARDTVTRVNVLNRDVTTVAVGDYPSVVRITEDYRQAVVFNQGDASVTLLDALTLESEVVPVRDNLNSMVLSPDGRWAVLWHSVAAERPDDPPLGGVASFSEVSLVDLFSATHVPLVVGFTPKDVTFTPDGRIALAVADASLAVLRLEQDSPVPEFIEVANPLDPPLVEEVEVSPDGTFAFLRQRGTNALSVVELDAGIVTSIPVGSDPTDLDLTQDGEQIVLVSRGAQQVATFAVDDPFAPPDIVAIPGNQPLGSVVLGPDGSAVLYTTAGSVGRYATWQVGTEDIELHPLPKPVTSLARTPTGDSLFVEHGPDDNSDGSTPTPYQGKPAISLVSLVDFRANTLRLDDAPLGLANSGDGRLGYLILEDQPYLEILDYRSLIYTELRLRSVPVHVGVLPDLDTSDGDQPPAWVSQEHTLGRLSFYDPDDDTLETITGFELNAAIEERP